MTLQQLPECSSSRIRARDYGIGTQRVCAIVQGLVGNSHGLCGGEAPTDAVSFHGVQKSDRCQVPPKPHVHKLDPTCGSKVAGPWFKVKSLHLWVKPWLAILVLVGVQ